MNVCAQNTRRNSNLQQKAMVQARSFTNGPVEVDGVPAPGLHYPTALAHLRTADSSSVNPKLGQKPSNGPDIIVADASCRLYIMNAHGTCRKTLGNAGRGAGEFGGQGVSAIAVAPDCQSIYVCDGNNHRLQKIRLSDAKVLAVAGSLVGRPGTGPSQLYQPYGLALFQDDEIFVSDSHNHRICVFGASPDGQQAPEGVVPTLPFLRAFGVKGCDHGQLQYPRGLAVWEKKSKAGDAACLEGLPSELLVADARNHRIQSLSFDGKYLRSVGGSEPKRSSSASSAGKVSGSSLFAFPSSLVVVDELLRLFVADQNVVTVLTLDSFAPLCVLSLSAPARLKASKPASCGALSLCAVPPTVRSGPLMLYVAEYTEHSVRELALYPEDLADTENRARESGLGLLELIDPTDGAR